MVEVRAEEEKKVKCLLVAPPAQKNDSTGGEPKELKDLVKTLGFETLDTIILNRIEANATYGIGTGKTLEIVNRAKEIFADCIIFDFEIQASKQRNWEKLAEIPVFDRNEVIIKIFAQRAQTKEASLQVELAKLIYSLPRLRHTYGELARQRGGSYGAKGSGETQLELDRRQIEDKIVEIKRELKQVAVNRETQRKQRERTSTQTCALVGYTNAGKSSLLNALTGANVFVEDKLFATLDPTTRKLALAEGSSVLITDTVGFISNLPHTLIDAFKSTLEESALANLLLIVVDSSDSECVKQYSQVMKVLQEINAQDIQKLVILNKFDKIENSPEIVSMLNANFPDAIYVSTKTQFGFEKLLELITEKLLGSLKKYSVPLEKSYLVELLRKNGTIEKEEWLENSVELEARIPGSLDKDGKANTRTLALLKDFQVG